MEFQHGLQSMSFQINICVMKKVVISLAACVSVVFVQLHLFAQSRIVLDGDVTVNINGGTSTSPIFVVVDNSNSNAITASGGGKINSEGEFNKLRWNIQNGTGNYSVPFANNSDESVAVVLTISSAGSADGAVDFSTYPTEVNNLPLPSGVNSIAHVDANIPADGSRVFDRFWLVEADAYSNKPGGTMSFSYNNGGMTGNLTPGVTQMAAQSHNGSVWIVDQLGADDLNGTVSGVPFSSASFNSVFTLVEFGSPLPITLLSFNAVWGDEEQSFARVFWTTASELDNDYFDVERSRDGDFWHVLGRVDGAGTSIHNIDYELLDHAPLAGIAYYRLKQVDFDGAHAYSHVVSLKREHQGPQMSVFPNPASDYLKIQFEGFNSDVVDVDVLDNSGRIILQLQPNILNNPEHTLSTSGFQSGVYLIRVNSSQSMLVQRVVIRN